MKRHDAANLPPQAEAVSLERDLRGDGGIFRTRSSFSTNTLTEGASKT
jgi:hypothetical protein